MVKQVGLGLVLVLFGIQTKAETMTKPAPAKPNFNEMIDSSAMEGKELDAGIGLSSPTEPKAPTQKTVAAREKAVMREDQKPVSDFVDFEVRWGDGSQTVGQTPSPVKSDN